ncbi:MAG: hypothetical protein H7222_07120 [Methylotenera sp.]|nr:hypothetical protein [Oligoflexia bacterium]
MKTSGLRTALILSLSFTALTASATSARADTAARSFGSKACTDQEKWTFSDAISGESREEMSSFLTGKVSPVRGFAEGLSVRRSYPGGEARLFAEYWISRALYKAKLYHIAFAGFSKIVSYAPEAEIVGIQLTAMDCLNRIHEQYPAIALPKAGYTNIPLLLNFPNREPAWDYTTKYLKVQMSQGASKSETQEAVKFLKGAGAYEEYGQALVSAKQNQHGVVVQKLNAFFARPTVPASLQKNRDYAHLVLARSLFTLQKFELGALEIAKINKSSNELSTALSELSWNYLMDDKLTEAIGAAMSLQAGGLRKTFSPEAPMVMAMALNELCQFPESIRAVSQFRRSYEKSYRWLGRWNKARDFALYNEAVKFLRKQSTVPERVATEWVRSPVFISHQDEINLLFTEKNSSQSLGKSGSSEQKKLAGSVVGMVTALKPKIRTARSQMKAGDNLPRSLQLDLASLRDEVTHFKRIRSAAGTWHMILKNHDKGVPTLEKSLVAQVEKHLVNRSERMFEQLEEIAENNQLIEVEIYNGASQDIIWQNAHPEYKKIAQQMNADAKGQSAEKVWNWGRAPAQMDQDDGDRVEVWEDELGSFKANMFDNCSSKERYLAIRKSFR